MTLSSKRPVSDRRNRRTPLTLDGKDFVPKGKDLDKPDTYPPLYTWRRQSQYRATMRTRIAEAGYDSLDVSTNKLVHRD